VNTVSMDATACYFVNGMESETSQVAYKKVRLLGPAHRIDLREEAPV
jgi:hypothetical protein